jgi:hypothetical protein
MMNNGMFIGQGAELAAFLSDKNLVPFRDGEDEKLCVKSTEFYKSGYISLGGFGPQWFEAKNERTGQVVRVEADTWTNGTYMCRVFIIKKGEWEYIIKGLEERKKKRTNTIIFRISLVILYLIALYLANR